MRSTLLALSLLLAPLASAQAHDHGGPRVGLSIRLGFDAFPELVQVPGTPVYYAPRAAANYFFHDGLFWLFSSDRWYSSAWYDGPWDEVAPEYVPAFVLRVPVAYYRSPPRFFHGWRRDAAPRWGDHWGREWEHRHAGWDRWDRRGDVRPAPLPAWQRQYAGDRYPREVERQRALHVEHGRGEWRGDDGRGRGRDDWDRGRGREGGREDRGERGGDHGRGGDRGDDRGDRGEHRR